MNNAALSSSGAYRLDDLELYVGQRRVCRSNHDIELPKLSFDLLRALVEAAPDTLSIDELMDRVWNNTVVSPATVAKRVELLREALGDDSSEPRYIALVRGHGYRLIPPITDLSEATDSRNSSRRLVTISIVAAAIAVAVVYLWNPSPPPEKSIAVLPFVSMSDVAEDEIFADGLTEELSHALARIEDLKVTGRTSSFHYKNRGEDMRTIGETLGVAHLLEGSVRRSGDKLRVTAQLVSTHDGFHLWSESYDSEMSDILEVQEDIAQNVALKLRATILNPNQALLARSKSANPEAYALYLKARSLSTWGAGPSLARAQKLIQQATELDPGFAPAWNRLAAIHGRRLFVRDPDYPYTPQEGFVIMKAALDRALAIDPNSGEGYANLGGLAWAFEGNAIKAAPLIQRALELDPTNLEIVHFAIDFVTSIGRFEEALELQVRLVDRDPLCEICRMQLARSYKFTGQLDLAEKHLGLLQVMAGGEFQWSMGVILLLKGQSESALASFERMDQFLSWRDQGRAMALHDLGRRDESAAVLETLGVQWGEEQPVTVAKAHAYVGNSDEAFRWLYSALTLRTPVLQMEFPDPLFAKLHADDRWLVLLERIGRAPHQTENIEFVLPKLQRPRLNAEPAS